MKQFDTFYSCILCSIIRYFFQAYHMHYARSNWEYWFYMHAWRTVKIWQEVTSELFYFFYVEEDNWNTCIVPFKARTYVAGAWHKLTYPNVHPLLMCMASLRSTCSQVCHQDTLCQHHFVQCSSLVYNSFIILERQKIIMKINVKLYIQENIFLSKTGEWAKFDWSSFNNIFVLWLLFLLISFTFQKPHTLFN